MEISDVITVRIFSPSLVLKSLSPSVCSVSVCVFKILGQTEILLLPPRSGLQTDESSPPRRSLLSAREQGLLLERDRVNVLGRVSTAYTFLFPQGVKCLPSHALLANDSETVSQLIKVHYKK